jgi:hypothetical protein
VAGGAEGLRTTHLKRRRFFPFAALCNLRPTAAQAGIRICKALGSPEGQQPPATISVPAFGTPAGFGKIVLDLSERSFF